MKAATKEMIRLALTSDETVPSDIAATGPEILERSAVYQNRPDAPLLMTMIAAANLLVYLKQTIYSTVQPHRQTRFHIVFSSSPQYLNDPLPRLWFRQDHY